MLIYWGEAGFVETGLADSLALALIPVEQKWFDKNTPAQLYGLMQSEAEFKVKEKKLPGYQMKLRQVASKAVLCSYLKLDIQPYKLLIITNK